MQEVLKIENLKKHYKPRGRVASRSSYIKALDGVNLLVPEGEIHSIVGETGSGKSTLGRIVAGLVEPTEGRVTVNGIDMFNSSRDKVRDLRKKVQIIFQDPYGSLNPRFTVKKIIEEPLKLNHVEFDRERITDILRKVGLTPPEDYMNRYPHELSGGQRQRVSIARSFVVNPSFVVADEPVSMLDASMRVSFLDLIAEIQRERGISMILISHDISIAYYLSRKINVLYLGRIVEYGNADDVVNDAMHPYTKALVQSVPKLGKIEEKEVEIKGNIQTSSSSISGCKFRDRCMFAMEKCATEDPGLKEVKKDHYVACHLY
ncbi:hypothetical protein IX51_05105 [uncultured archaeon]|nr:hypothetical protein IX51_05105 [uncultured archaeon]HKJ96940.1 ABC transporter ATP-binding protein [Thermoplasmataceae archaeon]